MTKYYLFSMLIFSTMLNAGDGKRPFPNYPSIDKLPNLSAPRISALGQHLLDGVTREQYLEWSSNRSQSIFSSMPSAGLIGLGINIFGCIVQTVGEALSPSLAAQQHTPVQRLASQETKTAREDDTKEEQESLEAIKSLSFDQIKMLAEDEERNDSDCHYFRNRYATILKLQSK